MNNACAHFGPYHPPPLPPGQPPWRGIRLSPFSLGEP
jgi:hypothetical protein